MKPVAEGYLNSVPSDTEARADARLEAEKQKRTLRGVENAIDGVDDVRDRLTDLYRVAEPGTAAEGEIGDALQAVRAAMKRLRKARVELMKQALPGM